VPSEKSETQLLFDFYSLVNAHRDEAFKGEKVDCAAVLGVVFLCSSLFLAAPKAIGGLEGARVDLQGRGGFGGIPSETKTHTHRTQTKQDWERGEVQKAVLCVFSLLSGLKALCVCVKTAVLFDLGGDRAAEEKNLHWRRRRGERVVSLFGRFCFFSPRRKTQKSTHYLVL
jgi:hypothetical protein